ncbi:MAG: hypothetical protein KC561_01285, partial [Myxococcales bacterium]|nr:hypothetical protein [Myxococcales bacterium]
MNSYRLLIAVTALTIAMATLSDCGASQANVPLPEPPVRESVLPLPHSADDGKPTPYSVAELVVTPRETALPDHCATASLTPYGLPYEPVELMSGYDDRRGRTRHYALDFTGVGPDYGLGDPIFAVGRSRVTLIGRSATDASNFGRQLRGSG